MFSVRRPCNYFLLSQIAQKITSILQALGIIDYSTAFNLRNSAKNNPQKAISEITSLLNQAKKGN